MSRSKKWIVCSVCLLIAISIFHDLTPNKQPISPTGSQMAFAEDGETEKIYVVERTIVPGDTLLSVIEEIHRHTPTVFNIDTVIHDFKRANNEADPYHLQVNQTYYFPLYMR